MLKPSASTDRSIEERIEQNIVPPNPVATKALTHLTMGSPQSVYNGGLLRAQVRYFDEQRQTPRTPSRRRRAGNPIERRPYRHERSST